MLILAHGHPRPGSCKLARTRVDGGRAHVFHGIHVACSLVTAALGCVGAKPAPCLFVSEPCLFVSELCLFVSELCLFAVRAMAVHFSGLGAQNLLLF